MKRYILIGAIAGALATFALVALLVAGVVGYRVVQAQTPPNSTDPAVPFWPGMMGRGGGPGMMGRWGGGTGMMGRTSGTYGPMHEYMLDAFADKLGLTVDEIQERLTSGETMWEIAQSTGLTDEQVTELMLAARTEALNRMVTDGVITQAQADWMIERMNTMHQNGFGPGSCHGRGGGRGPGGRWNNTPGDQ